MSMIEEIDNGTHITRYYTISKISSDIEALEWLSSVRDIPKLNVGYIYYCDLMNRSDEGSGNIRLDPKVNIDTMRSKFQERDVDLISLIGEFNEKPVVIGVDLNAKQEYITIRKKAPANLETLEKELKLL